MHGKEILFVEDDEGFFNIFSVPLNMRDMICDLPMAPSLRGGVFRQP